MLVDLYRNRKNVTEQVVTLAFKFAENLIQRIAVVAYSAGDTYPMDATIPEQEIRIATYGRCATEAVERLTEHNFMCKSYPHLAHADIYFKDNIYFIYELTAASIYAVADLVIHREEYNWIPEDIKEHWYMNDSADLDRLNNVIRNRDIDARIEEFKKSITEVLNSKESNIMENLRTKYDHLSAVVNNCKRDIETYQTEMNQLAAQMYFESTTQATMSEVYTQIATTIARMRTIVDLKKYSATQLELTILTPLSPLDEKAYTQLSTARRHNGITGALDWQKELLKDIMNKRCNLLIGQRVTLDCLFNSIRWEGRHDIGIANPHHKAYNCWGDYNRVIKDMQEANDYEAAIATVVTATAGINLYDAPVLAAFMDELKYAKTHGSMCILYNKSLYTIQQYLSIKEKEAAKDEIM